MDDGIPIWLVIELAMLGPLIVIFGGVIWLYVRLGKCEQRLEDNDKAHSHLRRENRDDHDEVLRRLDKIDDKLERQEDRERAMLERITEAVTEIKGK